MEVKNKATRINLFSLSTPQMRAFHMSWFAFFLCFFAWFGIAPLMAIVRDELHLTKAQIGNTIIASVAITILVRLFIGWLCDKIGPRLSYTWLLLLASIPVMSIGFANSYETFLLFRLGIGAIGASFVITQYHTSVMFAPNVVGTANATSAGWGNLGGGVTQMIMPLVFAGFIGLGYSDFWSWRLSMVVAGAVCFLTGIAYYFFTTDLPNGNFKDLKKSGELVIEKSAGGTFMLAVKDRRVWALFFIYAACFGIELTINNIAALYYKDYFGLGLKTAGLVAGLFGLMNIFARTTGGIIGDKFGHKGGLKGRVKWLFMALFVEGIALMLFSRMTVLPIAIGTMIIFSLFVQMSEGATYSVVPFINKKALGSVSGIVGAGGNMGAVAAGFLLRSEGLTWPQSLLILGGLVLLFSFFTFLVTFSPQDEKKAKEEHEKALIERKRIDAAHEPTFKFPSLPEIWESIRPMDFMRVYLGIALAVKGIYFIVNMQTFEADILGNVDHFQNLIAWYVVCVNTVGGVCLALGFATRWAALFNVPVMIGAAIFVHGGSGLLGANNDLQFTLFILFSLILLAWRGSGKFSLDHYLKHEA
ncbi:MAG: MFS transporter [Bacteriovoracaceae bacterium]|jgi:MFS transporter, NNP family, nitrate/nitrite transporter|nr:MFS transporter [Bacteriovoracaceae bacterium]